MLLLENCVHCMKHFWELFTFTSLFSGIPFGCCCVFFRSTGQTVNWASLQNVMNFKIQESQGYIQDEKDVHLLTSNIFKTSNVFFLFRLKE